MTEAFPKAKLDKAMLDPASVFDTPEEVAACGDLERDQKAEILRRWAYDALELEVAEEESMKDGEPPLLDRIVKALRTLGIEPDLTHRPPTKQGAI